MGLVQGYLVLDIPGLVKLVSSRIFFCQLRNLLAVLFFLFSLDVALAFPGLFSIHI